MNHFVQNNDTICALSTANGMGAIALIRVSGEKAFELVSTVFSKDLSQVKTHTAHFGRIRNGEDIIDEVLLTVLHGGKSFTGEPTVEIACHGSTYIQQQLLQLMLVEQSITF